MKICLASNNKGKIEELKSLLSNTQIEIVSLADIGCEVELPETHFTFHQNSLQKAQFVYDNYQIACISDDSGLCIEALNHEPGVLSARYAGIHGNDKANIDLVLKKMENIDNRKAFFTTVVTFINPQGIATQFEGRVDGYIIQKPIGNQGFGYDPIFTPNGSELTFAQLSKLEKNKISHRAKAMEKLILYLKKEC